ncbi:MAG TPA: DUF2142 domain-containing protein [Acidimicrobiales bacterium]
MRDGSFARRSRRSWLRFGALFVLCHLWVVGTPLFAGPDEPAHAIKAASVARGQFLPPDVPRARDEPVTVPAIFANAQPAADCTKFKPEADASCVSFVGSREPTEVRTYVSRYQPAVYALAGLPLRVRASTVGVYAARSVIATITALCLACALADAERLRKTGLHAGALVALTPMTLFLSGTINPSAIEIAAALWLWAALLKLVRSCRDGVAPRGEIDRCGIAAAVLVLSRPLSPLWLALIAAVAAASIGTVDALRTLVAQRRARIVAGVVTALAIGQGIWTVIYDPVIGDATTRSSMNLAETLRASIGRLSGEARQMIGVFGWLDTPAPTMTYVAWWVMIGALVLVALGCGTRREQAVLGSTLALVVVLPVVLETSQAHELGLAWQGRYTLPLAVGIPMLASTVTVRAFDQIDDATRFTRLVAVGFVLGHFLAYYQLLRRYSVGASGPLLFFRVSRWDPPVPSVLLLVGYAVAVTVLAWSVVTITPAREPSRPRDRPVGT